MYVCVLRVRVDKSEYSKHRNETAGNDIIYSSTTKQERSKTKYEEFEKKNKQVQPAVLPPPFAR